MAKRQQPKPQAEKPEEKKDAGQCPVTGEACQKNCEKESCSMDILEHAPQAEKSSPKGSDLEKHPKFAKFKTGGQPT